MLLIWGFLSAVCLPCDCCRGVVGSAQGSSILKLRDHWLPLQRGHPNPRSINPTPWPEVHKALFDAIAPSGPWEPGLPNLGKRIPLAPRSSDLGRGSLALMPPAFGPYLPLPRGDGLAAGKGSLGGLLGLGRRVTLICGLVRRWRARRQQTSAESSPPIYPVTTPRNRQPVRDAPEPDGTFLGRWESQARDTDKHP